MKKNIVSIDINKDYLFVAVKNPNTKHQNLSKSMAKR